MHLSESEIRSEGLKLHLIMDILSTLYSKEQLISDYDFVGLYILIFLASRDPTRWMAGGGKTGIFPKSLNLDNKENANSFHINRDDIKSTLICNLPETITAHLDIEYINRKFFGVNFSTENITPSVKPNYDINVMDFFNCKKIQFPGLHYVSNKDNYINKCIINWANGLRPAILLFHIPSPLEVLYQQANGQRVVTAFISLPELSRIHINTLNYMQNGENLHEKDSLEFLLHDLKHMEHFSDPIIHYEQIGFFKSMIHLGHFYSNSRISCQMKSSLTTHENPGIHDEIGCFDLFNCHLHRGSKPKYFFLEICHFDKQLWKELEYVISDMNCFVPHLLQYLLAKMLFATERQVRCLNNNNNTSEQSKSNEEGVDIVHVLLLKYWLLLLEGFGCMHEEEVFRCLKDMVPILLKQRDRMTAEEGEVIRSYFQNIGGANESFEPVVHHIIT